MKGLCLIDHLFDRGVGGTESQTGEHSTDMHVRRDVYGEVIGKWYFEPPCKVVCCQVSDFRSDAIKLKKAIDYFCTGWFSGPNAGGVARIPVSDSLHRRMKDFAHYVNEAVERFRL